MEEDVNYSSVVFKANKAPPPRDKSEEESVYDQVKVEEDTTDPAADTPGKLHSRGRQPTDTPSRSCHGVQVVAWCLGILCVILLSAVIALYCNLTQANGNLTTENLQLKTESSNLERRIENMTRDPNLTLAQWTLDAYCPYPKEGQIQERKCKPCQKGWLHFQSSCYAINDAVVSDRKTWKEAQKDCRGKNSDLVVIGSPEEQGFIYDHNFGITGEFYGYWIGLTDEAGSWKWVDGRNLTEEFWIKPPPSDQRAKTRSDNAHCAFTLKKTQKPRGWNAVNCAWTNRWICEMKALTV